MVGLLEEVKRWRSYCETGHKVLFNLSIPHRGAGSQSLQHTTRAVGKELEKQRSGSAHTQCVVFLSHLSRRRKSNSVKPMAGAKG